MLVTGFVHEDVRSTGAVDADLSETKEYVSGADPEGFHSATNRGKKWFPEFEILTMVRNDPSC